MTDRATRNTNVTPEEYQAVVDWWEGKTDVAPQPKPPAPKATMTPEQATQARAVMQKLIKKIQEAKALGDKELAASLAAQYTTVKDALQEYKQEAEERELVALRKEVHELRAEVRTLKVSRNDWKFKHDVLQDEVRTLRNPAPPMTANIIKLPKIVMDEDALEADYQKFFEHLDRQGEELRRQGR